MMTVKVTDEELLLVLGYKFPRAAITKYCELGGIKQKKCILSQCWRLEVQNQDGSFLPVPLSGSLRNSWSCGSITPVSVSFMWLPSLSLCVCVHTSFYDDTSPNGLGLILTPV